MGLPYLAGRLARDLTQEQQKRLAMALAIVSRPRLLLLDEPSAGINAEQTRGLIALIEKIAASGVTVRLIEHQMQMVMHLCRRIMVLDYGKKIADGTPDEIAATPQCSRNWDTNDDGSSRFLTEVPHGGPHEVPHGEGLPGVSLSEATTRIPSSSRPEPTQAPCGI